MGKKGGKRPGAGRPVSSGAELRRAMDRLERAITRKTLPRDVAERLTSAALAITTQKQEKNQ